MTKTDKEFLLEVYNLMATGRIHQARWMLAQFLGIIDPDLYPLDPVEPEVA